MNRRDFLRSGAIFGAAVAIAPAVALAEPQWLAPVDIQVKLTIHPHEFGCPGFEAIREDLIVGWKQAYGQDACLDPWTADGQLINVLASNMCDMYCNMARVYQSFSPQMAIGEDLDRLAKMNGRARRFIDGRQPRYSPFGVGHEVPNETDEEIRERMRKRA
jgi:hypothetical protein